MNQYVSLGQIFPDACTGLTLACWIKHPRSSWQEVVGRSIWTIRDRDQPANGLFRRFG